MHSISFQKANQCPKCHSGPVPDCQIVKTIPHSYHNSPGESLERTASVQHMHAFQCVCLSQCECHSTQLNPTQWSFKCKFCPDLGVKENCFSIPAPSPLPASPPLRHASCNSRLFPRLSTSQNDYSQWRFKGGFCL